MENKFADINSLKEYIKQILSMYEDQKQFAEIERSKNEALAAEIEEKAKIIKDLKNQNEVLKTAKTISVSTEDTVEVKNKINKIVREIDKSIGLLNE